MTFISYAQNFEGVMLWRCFKDLSSGFYIDAGAKDPTIDSVTKAFYDRGWSGINIKPTPTHFKLLLRERIREVNLRVAVGNSIGELELSEFPESGLSTAVVKITELNSKQGKLAKKIIVELTTLRKT